MTLSYIYILVELVYWAVISTWWCIEGLFVQKATHLVLTPFGSLVGNLHLINLAAKRRAVNRIVYRCALNSIVHWNWALSRLEGWVFPWINARVVSPLQPVRGLAWLCQQRTHSISTHSNLLLESLSVDPSPAFVFSSYWLTSHLNSSCSVKLCPAWLSPRGSVL